jgi:hypothetical protein
MTTATSPFARATSQPRDNDEEFDDFLAGLQNRFTSIVLADPALKNPLFTTDAFVDGLYEAYLAAFPADRRQHYSCHCCRRFIETYGGLVVVDDLGHTHSPIWDDSSPPFAALNRLARRAKITGVFVASEKVYGVAKTPAKDKVTGRPVVWDHLAVAPPKALVYAPTLSRSAYERAAELKEDFKNVMRALDEFSADHVATALHLLDSESLYRSEKVIGPAKFLAQLHDIREKMPKDLARNLMWRVIANAPPGFAHPRSTMIGTLLEDIAGGKSFAEVSRAFGAKMNPTRYQRPTAAPKAQAIAEAEKIVAELGAAGSLRRRYARLEDLQLLWRQYSNATTPSEGGVFSKLKAKGSEPKVTKLAIPPVVMTWEKFARTVLPNAEAITFIPGYGSYNFAGLVTAADPDSPPILQWDTAKDRNPVSWYVYPGGSKATQFSLTPGKAVRVTGVALKPSMRGEKCPHQGTGVVFLLEGARDKREGSNTLCLFPETLRNEFHGIRSVIEAYSRENQIEGIEEGNAFGIMIADGKSRENAIFEVTVAGKITPYIIDRWD